MKWIRWRYTWADSERYRQSSWEFLMVSEDVLKDPKGLTERLELMVGGQDHPVPDLIVLTKYAEVEWEVIESPPWHWLRHRIRNLRREVEEKTEKLRFYEEALGEPWLSEMDEEEDGRHEVDQVENEVGLGLR